jgi:hypothetical protein
MSAMRELDKSDYDLERFIEMFDEAMTSDDPRVKNALRQLMMMVILTSGDHEDKTRDAGPLRRILNDMHHMNRRLSQMEEDFSIMKREYNRVAASKEIAENRAVYPKDYWNLPPNIKFGMTAQEFNEVQVKLAHKINSGKE